jgi:anti-anti-sigma factor
MVGDERGCSSRAAKGSGREEEETMVRALIEQERIRGVRLLRLSGDLGVVESARVAERLDAALRAGARLFVVNLRDVRRADLSTLGGLLRTHRRLRERRGELVVSEPPAGLRPAFGSLGLGSLLRVFPSDADAMRYFGTAGA